MHLDLTELSYEPKWYDYKGARFSIRPYPQSEADIAFRDGALVFSGREMWEKFNYCLVGWEAIEGAGGKPLPCNEETKKKVFDFDIEGIPAFVLNTVRIWGRDKEALEKNS